ncbi:hypothetical protein BSYN_16830 [Bacteroides sedimenti]|uniref:Uncharacterized protein n=1 Tax=Bacteroides sedimenti TaxID=2136147 RepID=A0ABN6ZAI7_9BACE
MELCDNLNELETISRHRISYIIYFIKKRKKTLNELSKEDAVKPIFRIDMLF